MHALGNAASSPCRAHLTVQMALQHIRHDCLAWNSTPPARVTCPRTRHAFRRPARITDQCTRTRTRRAAAGAGSPSIAGITVSDAADHGRRSERPCAAVGSIVRGAERPPKAGRPDHGSTKTMCSDCGITRAQSPLCAHLKSVSA